MGKSANRKRGRPPGRVAPNRPVVSARVPENVYEAVKKAARESGRTISEELVYRAHIALQIGDVEKHLSEVQHVTENTLRAKMQGILGLKPVHDARGTYWLEPGMPALKGRLDPEVKAAITDAVREVLAENRSKS